jgi:hypothetical protein
LKHFPGPERPGHYFPDYLILALRIRTDVLRAVTLQKSGEGSAEASVYSCSPGTTVVLSETSADGWKFVKWESQQVTVTDGSFVMPNENVTLKAVFEKESSSPGFDWRWWLIILIIIACIIGGYWYYNRHKA